MARFAPNNFYSNGFNSIRNAAVRRIVVLDAQITTYASIAAGTLAATALVDANLTEAPGAVSGRRLNVAAFNAISISASGDATHVAIVDDDADVVQYITTCTTQTLTAAGTVTIPTWGIEVRAPAAP